MPEIPAAPLNLTDRTVLVTGGNGGIGLGMASACGAAGAQIVIWGRDEAKNEGAVAGLREAGITAHGFVRSEEHTSELQSLMRISYAVFCLKKKNCKKHRLAPLDTIMNNLNDTPKIA